MALAPAASSPFLPSSTRIRCRTEFMVRSSSYNQRSARAFFAFKPRRSNRCPLRCVSRRNEMQESWAASVDVWQCVPGGSCYSWEDMQRCKVIGNSNLFTSQVTDLEDELEQLFLEVKSMLRIGDIDAAKDLLWANYEVAKEQVDAGVKTIEQAAVLDVVALGYVAVGDLKLVEHVLNMLTEIVGGLSNDERLLDTILIHMGSMYTTLQQFDKAASMYTKCLETQEQLFGKQSELLVMPLLGLAKVFKLTGGITRAIDTYNKVIAILEANKGVESEELVVPLSALGDLFINEARASDAEASFNRILSIYTKSYGANDGRVGMAMCSLAHALCAKGNIEGAINMYQKGLEIIEESKHMAPDDGVLEKMRIDLAELLHTAGRLTEGREILEECLLIAERYRGSEHPSLATHLVNLATSYSRSKNFVEAERILRTSIRIMSKAVAPDDQSITIPMLHLAIVLYNLERDKEAESITLKVLHVREDAFGKESLPVGEALDCLVSIQMRLEKKDDEVLSLLKRLLIIQEKELGSNSEEVMVTLKKIVFFLDKMGKRDEKMPFQRRLSTLRTKLRDTVSV